MPIISVRIPQLGEGLQEALLVEFIAKPGDVVKRDDPIYVMETDKATQDVESPYDGRIIEWTVEEGSVQAIGAEIAKMEVAEGVSENPVGHGPAASASQQDAPKPDGSSTEASSAKPSQEKATATDVPIPPKTRKYLKELGLLDVAGEIPFEGTKLMNADVDRYLAGGGGTEIRSESDTTNDSFADEPISKSQQTLNYRLHRGAQACVPVTMMKEVDWTAIAAAREQTRQTNGPSGFTMLLWCVAQSMKEFPRFRSSLIGGKTLRTFENVHLGIAVGLPDDELLTAVVRNAETLDRQSFDAAVAESVASAREGNDQVDAATTLTVSNIGGQAIRWGIPAIVSPAVATLAVGEVFEKPVRDGDTFTFLKSIQLVLSFDHRVANGVGAAAFLNDIAARMESFQLD